MTEPPFHYPHDDNQPPPETHQQDTTQFAVPPQPQPSFWQRYKAALLAGGLVLVLVIAGLVWAVAASSTSEAAPSASSAPPSPGPSSPAKGKAKDRPILRGTVTAENGDTWTVKTDKGDTLTVAISDDTKFGTVKEPTDKTKIAVNSKVVITGKNADGKVDAKRIRLAER